MKKLNTMVAFLLGCSLLSTTSAYAFSDVQGEDAKVVDGLRNQGIVQGISKEHFAPTGHLTGLQGFTLILKALQKTSNVGVGASTTLTLDQMLAAAKSLDLPIEQLSNQGKNELTKEEFSYTLFKGIHAVVDYPLIKMFIEVADDDQFNPMFQGAVQNLLLMKIATLDNKHQFNPKDKITRIEAAHMISKAVAFVNQYGEDKPEADDHGVSYVSEKVSDQINKIILTRGQQANPGYGITISHIEFNETTATIHYKLLSPEPGKMYPQVMTEAKVSTYIDSDYQVKLSAD
ncbi:hypothetical protein J2Z69_002061 [Paenibacillus shirakamiensis]|uniref:SLH domain-containing protein n=1 Tax=Paenibacillus shirakamiensis TaxID=1265935 RepID=A0ABS4JH20_9BACL|nr:protease complex subunit PrcB family protein [Paenibacillus shirakamiensis]MBP2001018.1 hypothetical protein [Paenibacillus shirakamiensis]